jgi:hypothetical protein
MSREKEEATADIQDLIQVKILEALNQSKLDFEIVISPPWLSAFVLYLSLSRAEYCAIIWRARSTSYQITHGVLIADSSPVIPQDDRNDVIRSSFVRERVYGGKG